MNRNDRNIALAALGVAACAIIAILWLGNSDADNTDGPSSQKARTTLSHRKSSAPKYFATESQKPELFPFDPNTADSTQLLRLGLQAWQVRNIYRYRAKGGIYRKKEDFARLYGLTVGQYRRLEPYIRIGTDYQPAAALFTKQGTRNEPSGTSNEGRDTTRHYPVKIKADEHIVLNTADTADLMRIPGIGPYYARQIVRYGERLGGYVSVSQLDEIEGFPEESKQYLTIEHATPRRLNINRLSLQQLRHHPYITYYMAKAITDYRRLHGNITSLNQLSLSPEFTPEAIARLEPYVEY